MPHRLVSRESLILATSIWAIYALLDFWITDGLKYLTLIWAAHGFVLMLVLGVALDRVLRIRSLIARLAISTALAITFAVAQTVLDLTTSFTIGAQILNEIESPPGVELSATNFSIQTAAKLTFKIYVWLFGFYVAILAMMAATQDQWRARLVAERAQIEALRLQINPHFLFNALTGMDSLLAQNRTDQAREMLHSLSDFYRSTLMDRDHAIIPLEDELGALHDYAEVERIRFGDRLNLVLDLPEQTDGTLVPPLLLQPLVENALKYGDPGGAPLTVRLAVTLAGDRLEIDIRNPLVACAPLPGTGTGLANVKARLRALYGEQAGLEAGPHDGEWRTRAWMPRQPGVRDRRRPALRQG